MVDFGPALPPVRPPARSVTAATGPVAVQTLTLAELVEQVPVAALRQPHRLDHHLLLLVTVGHGTQTVDFVRYRCRPGTLIWARPGQVVRYGAEAGFDAALVRWAPDFLPPLRGAARVVEDPFGPVWCQLAGEDEDAVINEVSQLAVDCQRHPGNGIGSGPVAGFADGTGYASSDGPGTTDCATGTTDDATGGALSDGALNGGPGGSSNGLGGFSNWPGGFSNAPGGSSNAPGGSSDGSAEARGALGGEAGATSGSSGSSGSGEAGATGGSGGPGATGGSGDARSGRGDAGGGSGDGELGAELLRHQLAVLVLRVAMLLPYETGALPNPDAPGAEAAAFVRFRREVESSFTVSRRVEEYAARMGCSVRTLTRASLAATGRSAKQLIDDRVALEAKRLLAHTDQSVAVIGHRLGFPEPTNFGRFFSREVGLSPGTFRTNARH